MQLLAAIVKITMANITFAFLMIHNSFCKINEFRAKFVVNNNLIITLSDQIPTNTFKLQQQYGEYWPIFSEHISCLKKARIKLPQWVEANCIFPRTPFEQATPEWVAQFHAAQIQGSKILSITGGLGADDFAFAAAGKDVISLDPDACLNAVVAHNAQCLNVQIQRITDTAENFLAHMGTGALLGALTGGVLGAGTATAPALKNLGTKLGSKLKKGFDKEEKIIRS
jgi:hypothetical protein